MGGGVLGEAQAHKNSGQVHGSARFYVRSQFALAPVSHAAAALILRWRNSDRVRAWMFNDAMISAEQHKQWITRILQDENVRYRIFCFNGRPIGLVSFTEIDRIQRRCSWGFYIGENNVPKGMGTALGYWALNDAFTSLEFLQEITGEVLGSNSNSLALHNRLGFVANGTRTMQRHGKTEEVVLFVLSREAWANTEGQIAERLF